MAYCATVTMHDNDGEALHTIRYGRMPAEVDSLEQLTHRDVHRMMQRLRDDVIAIRRRAGPVPVVLLADGASELWRLFEQHLNEKQLGAAPGKLVDAWQALEYIARCGSFALGAENAELPHRPPACDDSWLSAGSSAVTFYAREVPVRSHVPHLQLAHVAHPRTRPLQLQANPRAARGQELITDNL